MALSDVAIGVFSSVIIVQSIASNALQHASNTSIRQARVNQIVGICIAISGLGMASVLFGLAGKYLKTTDIGLIGPNELIPIQVPHEHAIYFGSLLLFAGLLFSSVAFGWLFIRHTDTETENGS